MIDLPPEFSATPLVAFVGEDNPYGANPEFALYPRPDGCSGHRLCDRILGLSERVYLMPHIRRMNLCGDSWSTQDARDAASELIVEPPAPVIVLLGAKVRAAVEWYLSGAIGGKVKLPAFAEHVVRGGGLGIALPVELVTLIALPHPSGRNLIWNEPGRIEEARALLRAHVPGIPWGAA